MMKVESNSTDELHIENLKGMHDWYKNRAKLAKKHGDVEIFFYLNKMENHYSGLLKVALENDKN